MLPFLQINAKFPLLASLTVTGLILTIPFATASDTPIYAQYACQPITQDVGRIEPSVAAELSRFAEGYLNTVDIGGEYYATEIADAPLPEWIIVYGTEAQRGNSEIGYVQTNNLICEVSETLN